MHYQYLVIGAGIAGVTAAETIRAHDPHGTIGILGEEPHLLYSRVLLPSYLKERIPRAQLFLRTAEHFTNARIDLRLQENVTYVDTKHREVGLASGVAFTYDKLLIATGGHTSGQEWLEDRQVIYRLQTLDDADRLFEKFPSLTSPLVVGSSFISLEFLEIFLSHHVTPRLLVRGEHFFSRVLEEEGGKLLEENFKRHGAATRYQDTIGSVAAEEGGIEVTTKKGDKVLSDALCLGIGIDRAIGFLAHSGLETGQKGIRTNAYLETNVSGVYAAGDVAEFEDVIAGRWRIEGNWTNAILQGKRAGLNMIGDRNIFKTVPSYSITNLGFQITVLGDTENPEEAVVRADPVQRQYERIFLRGGAIAGAVLINRFADKPALVRLIEAHTNIQSWRPELPDISFDIHTIPVLG